MPTSDVAEEYNRSQNSLTCFSHVSVFNVQRSTATIAQRRGSWLYQLAQILLADLLTWADSTVLDMVELNFDTLSEVMARIDCRADISRMGRTCHPLHRSARQELLRRGVTLWNKKTLPSFYRFITVHSALAPLLHKLDIRIYSCKKFGRFAGLIAQIIIRCGWTEDLTFDQGFLLDDHLGIVAAICTLRSLRSLNVSWLGGARHTNIMLSHMQSPCLQVLQLDYQSHSLSRRWGNSDGRDPSDGLRGFAASITTLDLCAATFWIPTVHTAVFSRLTRLVLTDCVLTGVTFLMHAFPNLQQLILNSLSNDNSPIGLDDEGARFTAAVVPWDVLDYCEGPVALVRGLHIPCQVCHWVVTPDSYGRNTVDDLVRGIAELRPTRLDLSLSPDDLHRFTTLVSDEALTHLALSIGVKGATEDQIEHYQVR